VGEKLLIRAASDVSGVTEREIISALRDTGDIGASVEHAMELKRQMRFHTETLSVMDVYNALHKLARLEGRRSQEKKLKILGGMLTDASPCEAKYLSRIVVETMRTGVGEGIVRDAIAQTYGIDAADVEKAYMLSNDMGLVAGKAQEGLTALRSITLKPFRPIKMMAAQKVQSASEGFDALGRPCALEYKYDGFRMQIHRVGDDIRIFTRRLEDVTVQFSDVVDAVRNGISRDCIVEGETIGIGPNGAWLPFQQISRRIKRKYDIEEAIENVPVMTNLFDILYLDGEILLDEPFYRRREALEGIVAEIPGKLVLSRMIVTGAEGDAQAFFDESIAKGNEGLMLKRLDSPYVPGLRVGTMLKLKSVLESLDCIIVGAEWGSGRRASFMGSFRIAILDETGSPSEIGKVATGITDEMLEELTRRLRPLIVHEDGTDIELAPEQVVEVAYEEIQRSPHYDSGFALRFPRLIRLRDDKGPEDADTILRVFEIFENDTLY
jgi:DNA ligase-1